MRKGTHSVEPIGVFLCRSLYLHCMAQGMLLEIQNSGREGGGREGERETKLPFLSASLLFLSYPCQFQNVTSEHDSEARMIFIHSNVSLQSDILEEPPTLGAGITKQSTISP